jgi:hypothetical protein
MEEGLTWLYSCAVASRETQNTARQAFTHQRSAVRDTVRAHQRKHQLDAGIQVQVLASVKPSTGQELAKGVGHSAVAFSRGFYAVIVGSFGRSPFRSADLGVLLRDKRSIGRRSAMHLCTD